MERVFLTGGSGFVGSALIRALSSKGTRVRALARSDAAEEAVARAGAEPVRGDLDNLRALREGMASCDAAFHAAAYVEQWGSREDFFKANVAGTSNVINAARAEGVPVLVHVSTEAVLAGERPIHNADETQPLAAHPAGLYSLTKGIAEERMIEANSPDLRTVIIRPRFIWGKGDTSLMPKIAKAVREGRYLWIDHGRYLTSTCHIDNVIEGALLAAERGKGGSIYFLTDGPPVQFREFITKAMHALGENPKDASIPRWIASALAATIEAIWAPLGLEGEPPVTKTAVKLLGEEVTVNDEKARRELGYLGAKSVEDGLREMEEATRDEKEASEKAGGDA